jgi:hypothetical protein
MGRHKLFEERITLPLKSNMLERIDAALEKDEPRLDLIREALERELKKRERQEARSDLEAMRELLDLLQETNNILSGMAEEGKAAASVPRELKATVETLAREVKKFSKNRRHKTA